MENNEEKTEKPRQRGMGHGPMAMIGSGAKANDFRGSMAKLFNYISKFRSFLVLAFVFAILGAVFTIVSPKLLGDITNQIVEDFVSMSIYDQVIGNLPEGMPIPEGLTGESIVGSLPTEMLSRISEEQLEMLKGLDLSIRPTVDFESILHTILILIGLYLLSAVFNYVQIWLMTHVSQQVTFQLRAQVFQKINQLPLKYFDTHSVGDTLSRITNDIDTIAQTLNQSLAQSITAITTIVGIIIMMLTISWELTIVALLVLPISMMFIGFIVSRSQKLFKQQADELGAINGHIEETYSSHNIVRAYNGEAAAIKEFNELNSELYVSGWKSQFLSGLMMPIMRFIGNLGYVAVATIGGWLAFNGKLGIGGIQAFIQYMQQFNQPIMQAANTMNVLQSTAAASERVFEFLEEEDEVPEAKESVSLGKIEGHIRLDHIVFGYDENKPVIKDVSVEVQPGQRIAIVGPTGSGKTTLVNLLMRFYDVNSGTITIDGVDITKVSRAELRKQFGMVLQDTWLFNGTIKENLAYSKPTATDEEIYRAAKAAQVDHFVHSLPNGYDLVLNENSDNISQGEKQLLTIARAMLADSPILILDEATSSVDTRTEVLIQSAMDKLMEGRTSFIIAHRLSTIKNADLILVLKHGNIIEQGTHQELLDQGGFYKQLYNSQFDD